MRVRPWFILLAAACGPLNSSSLSPPCKYAYNQCLSKCPGSYPSPQAQPPPGQPPIETASCTERCNAEARACQ